MPGRNSGDNKLGLSPFIVGPAGTLGDGCTYDSIQAAIDDAILLPTPPSIYIRAGTYTEDLTLHPKISLIAASFDGRLALVEVIGNHTMSTGAATPGPDGVCGCKFIYFSSAAGDTFTVNNPTDVAILVLTNCSVNSADRGIVLSPGGPAFAVCVTQLCDITTVNDSGTLNGNCQWQQIADSVNSVSGTNYCVNLTAGNSTHQARATNFQSTNGIINIGDVGAVSQLFNCSLQSSNEAVVFSAAGQFDTQGCLINANAVSTFWITGAGTVNDASLTLNGSARNFDPATTESPLDWHPYARSGAMSAGTSRGTAAFSTDDFSNTDGFIELLNGPTGLTWNDESNPGTVTSFSGSFVISTIGLNLPASPQQGDTVAFKVDGAFVLTIQAQGAQMIKMGNQVSTAGGTATSTLDGDAVELTYRSGSDTWIANSLIGNWNLA